MKTGALTFLSIAALSKISTIIEPKNHPTIAFAASYRHLNGQININNPGYL
jgi:hypothetical protein